MGILMWEKPKKVMSSKEHADSYQADGAPPGTYVSNMSREDEMRWKAKFVGTTLGFPQVELRRNGMVIVLSKKGYKYNGYDTRQSEERKKKQQENHVKYGCDIRDSVVHIASSGAQAFTVEEYGDFMQALKEDWEALESLEKDGVHDRKR